MRKGKARERVLFIRQSIVTLLILMVIASCIMWVTDFTPNPSLKDALAIVGGMGLMAILLICVIGLILAVWMVAGHIVHGQWAELETLLWEDISDA